LSSSTVLRDERFPRRPLNGCSACLADFASVSAFDRHRYGTYEPLERRCMDEAEMLAGGLEVDPRGRWRIAADAVRVREAFSAVRLTPESPVGAEDEDLPAEEVEAA
jgi:hypothetical protein